MSEQYFQWLIRQVGIEEKEDGSGYLLLCQMMQEKTFYPLLEKDENRCKDGERYRLYFAKERTDDQKEIDMIIDHLDRELGGCTVLELIVSLAEKMAYELLESPYEAPVFKWFDELIDNLGLDRYIDSEFMENEDAYFDVDRIMDRMIFRRYGESGSGSLFPIPGYDYDQRHAEIIVQMNNYIAENYDIL